MDSEAPALTTAEGKAAVERWLADVLAQSDEKLVGTEEQAQAWAEAVKRTLTLMLCDAGAAGGVLRYSALDGLLQTDRNPDSALEWLGGAGMRRVCQYAFTKNDIVWICTNCQADETCVLCNDCFRDSDHTGHEVYFYHAHAGGCCDCGDKDALDSAGFCTKHGGPSADPIKSLNPAFVSAAQTVLSVVVGFLLDCAHQIPSSADLAAHSEGAFAEALNASDGDVVVVLHHDDVHNRTEFEACGVAIMDREPTQMSADFRTNGESYATKSLLPEGSPGESHYDRMVALAKEMTRRTFMATIRAKELQRRLMFADVLAKWLHKLSLVSDATCALICQQLQRPQLDVLLAADVYLPRRLSAALHDLYLTLMADAGFKMDIAEAYVSALPALTEHYVEGRGVAEYSIQSLSVQFLNRSTFVQHLVQHNGLLPTLAQCLYDSLFPIAGFDFSQASDGSDNYPLVLKYRRYMPTFGDLRCVLAIDGIARQFAGEGLELWLQSLALLQGLDGQRRQTHAHVEYEHRSWVHAFNVNITVCSAFDLIVSWLHDPVAGIDYPAHISQEDAEAGRMPHPLDMLRACLQAVRHHEEAQARLRVRAGAAAAQAALSTRRLSAQLMMDEDLPAPSEQQAEALPPPSEAPSPAEAGVDEHGMVLLPVFPHGGAALQLAPVPPLRSFHAPLHRFLAAAVGQAARCAARTPDVQTLAAAVTQQASAGTKLAAALVDVPLQVLVLVSEIRAGLWRRNGQCMSDQVLNCADPPFSRLFKDLDLFAIQFAAIGYGANALINHIVHRYRCWEWWLSGPAAEAEDHKDEPDAHDQATAAADYSATNPNSIFADPALHTPGPSSTRLITRASQLQRRRRGSASDQPPLSPEHQLLMGEGCLLAMINVITELPPPPDETQPMAVARAEASATAVTSAAAAVTDTETISVNTRVWAQLRRELVHRLAVAPCTFSELQEASHMVGQADALPSKALDVLLSEIATQNGRGGVLEGVKYTLRPQLYKEYDPSFPHITRQMHQLVAEKLRPSPRQSPEPSGNRAEDSAAAEGAAPVCPPPPPAHSCFNHLRAELLSDVAMARLIASSLRSCAERESGSELASETLLLRAIHLLTLGVYEFQDTEYAEGRAAFCRGLLAEGVSKLLLALKGCSWLAEERTAVGGIAWLLRELRGFGYGLGESIPDEAAAGKGGGGAALAARKAAAQARAMAAMQERAKMFAAAQMRAMGVDSDEEDLSDADMDQDQGSGSAHQEYVPPPPPICIACHEVTAEPVGHIAFAHRSSVLDLRANAPNGVPPPVAGPTLQLAPMNGASQIQPTEADYKLGFRGFAGVHLHLCGHALHSSCFARYYDSVRGQTDIFGRPVTDLDAGEFRCPFCKALSNVLVPHVVPPLPESPAAGQQQPPCGAWARERLPVLLSQMAPAAAPPAPPSPPPSPPHTPPRQQAQQGPTPMSPEPSQQQPQASPAAAAVAVEAAQEEEPSPAAAEAPVTLQEAGSWLSGAQFVRDVALVYFGTATGGDARAAAEPVPHEHYVAAAQAVAYTTAAVVSAAGESPMQGPTRDWQNARKEQIKIMTRALRVAAGSEPLRSTMASAAGAAMLDNSPGGPKLPSVFTTPLPKILLEVLVMLCAALPPASAAGAAATTDTSGSGAASGAAAATDAAGDALRMAGNPAAADVRAMCGVACVARLVQLLIGAGMGPAAAAAGADHEGSANIDVACAYARAVLSDAVARAAARDTGSTGDMEVCGGSGAQVSARPCFADLDPSTRQHLQAFMRCCALFAEVITDGAALPPEPSDDEMASLCGFFGMRTSLTAVLQDRDVMHLVSLWLAPLTVAPGQPSQFALELVQLRYLSYPVGFSVRLVDLPKSYTDLHALLTSRPVHDQSTPRPPSDAFPAVCLVCGQTVSCGGDGSCWKHAAACSPNSGVFFLLQECTVLLTRGKRAAYFASPYVDAYGERHRQPRGRPLFLDERRYSVLRDLYARHAVAAEVARIRSSGREVLHAGYY